MKDNNNEIIEPGTVRFKDNDNEILQPVTLFKIWADINDEWDKLDDFAKAEHKLRHSELFQAYKQCLESKGNVSYQEWYNVGTV